VAGEWAALHILDTGNAGEWSRRLVLGALLAEGSVIVWFTWRVGGRGRLDTAETMTRLVAALEEGRTTKVSAEADESSTSDRDEPPTGLNSTPGEGERRPSRF
jgi:hypothetical protein